MPAQRDDDRHTDDNREYYRYDQRQMLIAHLAQIIEIGVQAVQPQGATPRVVDAITVEGHPLQELDAGQIPGGGHARSQEKGREGVGQGSRGQSQEVDSQSRQHPPDGKECVTQNQRADRLPVGEIP